MAAVARELLAKTAREHGLLLAITLLSILASLIRLFVDVSASVSIKWLLFAVLVASWMVSVLATALLAAVQDRQQATEVGVLGIVEDGEVLAVKSSTGLSMNTLVSVYETNKGHEALCGIGFVENVQLNGITSIRMRARYRAVGKSAKTIIKTTLPRDKIQVVQP